MRDCMEIHGQKIPVFVFQTVIVGSGCAGLAAADRLFSFGQTDIALVTEGLRMGTSRNTGSDKQTYYKLTLSGGTPDSVREMAETLFAGHRTDGDTALCESALSVRSFCRLTEIGVPFPKNRWGEFIGYKTDHDPRERATSAGPYTSRYMTEALEKQVVEKKIPVFDNRQVVRILVGNGCVQGLLCWNQQTLGYCLFRCENVIYATGGPAGIYAESVYPAGQHGGTGLALEAGVPAQNLTEWQYGLASVRPHWNVSGSFMQVLPRFISVDENGGRHEFLYEAYEDESRLLSDVFLKGYQWPFDVSKIQNSSRIDYLVYLEKQKSRRVFLDFRTNPGDHTVDFAALPEEPRGYLQKAGTCFGTPIERLLHMNEPAVQFYREHGIDLAGEPLEIALCAQHNNGGLSVDAHWQTALQGFFAVGEAAGTHGVYRPGGSALNAGQVGALRAAEYIAARRNRKPEPSFSAEALRQAEERITLADSASEKHAVSPKEKLLAFRRRMSRAAGPIRSRREMEALLRDVQAEQSAFRQSTAVLQKSEIGTLYRLWDMLAAQEAYLSAMLHEAADSGTGFGGNLYLQENGRLPAVSKEDPFAAQVQTCVREGTIYRCSWRPVRPIPETDDFFENVWRSFRETGNVE